MKALLALAALLLLSTAAAQTSFYLPPDGPTTASLWMHMTNDGTPLRGGNDQTTIGYMNIRPPTQPSILVGSSLGPAECPAPAVLPTNQRPTWQVGISPDRIPLPTAQNYNHYHWNEATMDFTLKGDLGLTWYAGIAAVGPAGELLPSTVPMEAVLQADLVVAHTDVADRIDDVVDQAVATGRSEPVLLSGPPLGTAESIVVDGFTAYKFNVRLNLTDGEVQSRPGSYIQLWLSLHVTSPPCGAANVAFSPTLPFAATDPTGGGLSVLIATTEDPIRVDYVEVHANRTQGLVRMHIQSPWGEADVEPDFQGQVGDVVLDELVALQGKLPEHPDFHPLFNGNYTWVWHDADGPGIVDVFVYNTGPSARAEAYLNFEVPTSGTVHCTMRPPEEATCTTEVVEAEMPGLGPLVLVLVVALAAFLRRG